MISFTIQILDSIYWTYSWC